MYLGIDLGTSGIKLLLIDSAQKIVASSFASLTVSRPHHGWSEQSPAEWIDATETALAQLKQSSPESLGKVKGIGLSGQMHGATLIDASDKVLRPCILWNDTRAHVEAASLNDNPLFEKTCGNIIFPGFTAPKLRWCERHEPDTFRKVAKVLLPKDYLRLWLTGDSISEMSDASGTGWLNIGDRAWSVELLDTCNLTLEQMPRLIEGTQAGGLLRTELAERFGLQKDVVVAGGAGDNAASACGLGTVIPGAAFASIGTSGVLFVSNEQFKPNAASAVHAFCHALPQVWHQMGVILSATDSLNWFANLTGQAAPQLTSQLGKVLKPPSSLTFLPYLSGERTPHNDAHIRGVFSGLTTSSDQAGMTQAILEGVCFAFRDNLQALQSAGTEVARLTAVGGGSQSNYWLRILATVLNRPVDVLDDGEFGAAFGAARLGLIAAEGASPIQICSSPPVSTTIEPAQPLIESYDGAYERYRTLYPALKPLAAEG